MQVASDELSDCIYDIGDLIDLHKCWTEQDIRDLEKARELLLVVGERRFPKELW